MTLRLKINLIVGALTLLFALAVLGLQLRSLRDSVQEEVVAANRVAAQLLQRMALRYMEQGTQSMLAFLQGIGRIRSNEVTLLDAQGRELYRSPPSPYKAGRDAPAWFALLVEPPASVQSISFPDGKLVVQASASRAALDAWDYMSRLAVAALALLLGVNALVFWLVGRTARPFSRIVEALNRVQAGRFDVVLPPLPGREAAAIGNAFNRMVGELAGHIETEKRAVAAETRLVASRELTRWIDQQLEQERRLIASELHDELGQSVTAMRSMALSLAQRSAGDAIAAQAARLIADEASRLYDAMQGIIPRLAPLVLDSLGLAEALGELVQRTRTSQPGVAITLDVQLRPEPPLGNDATLTLYRAAQEGITNALRHGGATRLALAVSGDAGGATLTLRDNGRGLPAGGWQRPGHYGLRWLQERAEVLGGEVVIEPVLPQGTQLTLTLPPGAAARTIAPP